jgi:acyl carrier protein
MHQLIENSNLKNIFMIEFIKNFADIFDETPIEQFSPDTFFKNIEEWSSLHILATINMIEVKYGVQLKISDVIPTNTIKDLYDLMSSRK